MSERDKVTVNEIIGLVDCEPTNSVEEVRKLRGRTNERFMVDTTGTLIDMVTRNTYDYVSEVVGLLNGYDKENEQLKSRVEYLERKINRERTSYQKQHEKWEEEIQKENEQLKADKQRLIDFIRKEFPKSHEHILEGFE